MDRIDRQTVIDEVQRFIGYLDQDMIDRLKIAIGRLPSAQSEIIRCKDCKHRPVMVWSKVYDDFDVLAPEVDGKEDWRCPCLIKDDPYYSWSPNDNWFCGNGERRESDADAEGKG